MKKPSALMCSLLFSLLLVLGVSLPAQAATALSIRFPTVFDKLNPSTVGWEFTVNTPVFVTALGVYDSIGDGLVNSHQVAIWTTGQDLVASTTVPAGTSTPIIDRFRYQNVFNATLSPGVGYRIGGEVAGNADFLVVSAASFTTDSRINLTQDDVYKISSPFGYPDQIFANPDIEYLTVNFQFENVPIPAAVWLFGTGLVGLVGFRRRFRK